MKIIRSKLLHTLFILLMVGQTACPAQLKAPNPALHYNEVAFLMSHNAFSSSAYGYIPYAQQKWSIAQQLNNGVRGLMLDVFTVQENDESVIRLCHRSCYFDKIFRPIETLKSLASLNMPKPESLIDALTEVRNFLDGNSKEIVTIIYEDHVENPGLLDQAIADSGIQNYILKPGDWNPEEHNGWPTLQWMQDNNKRLIMFSDYNPTTYAYNLWSNAVENQYSTIEIDKTNFERAESQKYWSTNDRYLFVFNLFPKFPIPYEAIPDIKKFISEYIDRNDYVTINSSRLHAAILHCVTTGINKNPLYKGRFPNFIALDFVNDGSGIAIVNAINNMKATSATWAVFKKSP